MDQQRDFNASQATDALQAQTSLQEMIEFLKTQIAEANIREARLSSQLETLKADSAAREANLLAKIDALTAKIDALLPPAPKAPATSVPVPSVSARKGGSSSSSKRKAKKARSTACKEAESPPASQAPSPPASQATTAPAPQALSSHASDTAVHQTPAAPASQGPSVSSPQEVPAAGTSSQPASQDVVMETDDGFQTVTRKRRPEKSLSATSSASDDDAASGDSDGTESDTESNTPGRIPPPIVIRDKATWLKLIAYIREKDIQIRRPAANTSGGIKIFTESSDDFRVLTKYLEVAQIQHHSYQLREERDFIVVLRGVVESIPEAVILAELKRRGLPVKRVHRMCKQEVAWPLVVVYLDNIPAAQGVFQIRSICDGAVTVERKQKSRQTPLCLRCLQYGHTKNFCHAKPVCSFCARGHTFEACSLKKNKNLLPKCAHCGGQHMGTYRGCVKAPTSVHIPETLPKAPQATAPAKTVTPTLSFANATAPQTASQVPAAPSFSPASMEQFMEMFKAFMVAFAPKA